MLLCMGCLIAVSGGYVLQCWETWHIFGDVPIGDNKITAGYYVPRYIPVIVVSNLYLCLLP